MKNISNCVIGDVCILTVSSGTKHVTFPTKIIAAPKKETKYGFGLFVEPVYQDNQRVSFDNVKLSLEYHNKEDKRLYVFNINNIGYDGKNNRLLLCSRQMAIPVNHRRAFRVDCGYNIKLHTPAIHNEVSGYCRDISYLGAALVISDPRHQIQIGDKVNAYIKFEKSRDEIDVQGKVVRIMDNWVGGRTLLGVEFFTTTKDIEQLVRQLQFEILQKRSGNAFKQKIY